MDGEPSGLHRERFQATFKRERSHSSHADRGSPNSAYLQPGGLCSSHDGTENGSRSKQAAASEGAPSHSPQAFLFELIPLSTSPTTLRSDTLKFGIEGLRIGRDRGCSDVVLNSAAVSRLHCVLSVLGDEVFVHDNSFNGTFINGKRVGRGRCSVLHPQDTISFMNPTCADAALCSFEFAPLPGQTSPLFPTIEGMQRYALGPVVGQGSFAAVRLATDRETGEAVAVKLIERWRLCSEDAAASLHTEIEMMRGMDHPNIVKVLDAFEGSGCVALVMEYVRGGDLFDYVVGRGRNPFTEEEARHLFVQLLEALRYIHGRNIIHCDLKPENVLVDYVRKEKEPLLGPPPWKPQDASRDTAGPAALDTAVEDTLSVLDDHQSEAKALSPYDVQLKLTDFGVAKYARGASRETVGVGAEGGGVGGTPVYAAPELAYYPREEVQVEGQGDLPRLAHEHPPSVIVTPAVDVWSLGVLLFILCSGTVPSPPPLGTAVALHRCMSHLSATCMDLIVRMMATDPEQRITLAGICSHPWLVGVELRGGVHDDEDDNAALSVTAVMSPRLYPPVKGGAAAARAKDTTTSKTETSAVDEDAYLPGPSHTAKTA
ncbi:putative protein kinase [Leptomonas seymouri]|uniref:Protein kinase n=1 Tax=Leptomonas seymouri TaxID=5684 RepID=A0A0N1HZY0_LEPSE|nr:putative protein kinase [Leptomonas seymouri]|eukprot:KPI88910.1 putative protein kinase [Leptomonas seymouri]